ncbi:hypothetical protein LIER_10733 [Lithospermum erythrorhizon]|uniref:Uncharacterized protein n=1 Tax=Lithospermum erythrorhizon TaxID=34254 RepID=A0AAV3PMP9_LITER
MHFYRKFSKNSMENGIMDELLTKLHSLTCQLKYIGKPITDEDLLFFTVMTTRQQYPTFSELRSLLINEEDRVKSKAHVVDPLHSSSTLYSDRTSSMRPSNHSSRPSGAYTNWKNKPLHS